MMEYETKRSLLKFVLLFALLLIIVALSVVIFYVIVFHEPVIDEPSISLDNLENIDDEGFVDDNYSFVLNDSEYVLFCELNFNKLTSEGLSFGKPVAFTFHRGPHYYSYYSQIIGLPEGEWLASFRENGSGGILTDSNCEYIWKRSDADVPEWLQTP